MNRLGRTRGSAWRILSVLLLGGLAFAFLMRGASDEVSARSNPYDAFPLAKDVPGVGPHATLGTGKLRNGTRWGVYASRLTRRPASRELPCISVARITRYGRYASAHRCSGLAPQPDGEPPVYVALSGSEQAHPDGPVVGEVVMGLSFQTSVGEVELDFASGGHMRRATRLFNPHQQSKTHLAPFRYIAFGMQRDVCVQTVTGYDSTGLILFEEETGVC